MSQQNFVSYDDATSIVTEVASKIAEKQDVLSFDNSPTQNSNNPVKSGGVYTALASKANTSDIGTAAAKNFTTSVTSGSNDLVTSGAVYTAIENLPEPMVFRGSLGTGGTITALPVDGTATKGDTYKVITDGTYASKPAKVGDTFVCLTKTSSANTWELIPSGDEPSGTVTSVTLKATSPIAIDSSSAITTSGTRTLSHANSGATAGSYGDSGNQTPGYGSTFKVPYVTVNATGHVTAISEHTVKIPASDNTNTTYTFAGGTNGFKVTPSGGSAQTVSVTPSFTVTTGDSNGQVKVNGTNASVKGLGSAAYTASSAYAPAGNYAGSSSAGGAANSLANFKVTNNTNLGIDDPGSNAIGYVSGLTKAAWNYQQTDGALYTQRYSDKWIVEMFQDYITGQVSVRGKNNGTWQGWRNILDSSNYASYVTPAGIGAATTSHTHTISQVTWGPGQNLTTSATANGQEWSIDLTPGSYTGTYFHVWSSKNSKSILCCYPDDNSVTIPNGSLNVSGTIKQNGTAVSLNGHTHNYAGSSSAGGVANSANKIYEASQNMSGYASTDTHILKLGYFNCSFSYDNITLLVTSSFWGNQHGSADIINIQQDLNNNSSGSIKHTIRRLHIGGSNKRTFYYKNDSTNKRVYIYVYVSGGNSYGRWNISTLQNSGTTEFIRDLAVNQPNTDLVQIANTVGSILYGTCSTATGTAAKVVTCADFDQLFTGVTIYVKFSNNNTADNPTLNVNSTGAKAIWKSGGNVKSSNPGWMANEVISFTYDGTRWIMNDVLSSGRLHTQGYNNNCDTSMMTCSVAGRSASLGGLLNVTQASQNIFTIGATGAYVIDSPAQGILINQSTKTIYPIIGIDNVFSSVSGNVPVGNYTVLCNFRVIYTYNDFA